jgi:alanine dehydrogenase
MRFVSAAEVHAVCAWEALVEALAAAHRGPEPMADRSELHDVREGGIRDTYFNLPAWQPGIAMGTKIVTVIPDNPGRRLPAVQALYVAFDGNDGAPLAVLDGTALTYRKTAADSALGSRLLARGDAATLLLVGAGGLAPYLAEAHVAVRPSLRRILVWNRSPEKAQDVAERLHAQGHEAAATRDLSSACRAADVISCATASAVPLVRGDWLRAGAHLDLVGAFTPEMRECDDAAVRRASLFVDSRPFAIDQPGDLADPIRRGIISRSDVKADLFELCRGRHRGRAAPEEITLFKNGGGAHLDLFTALFILRQLRVLPAKPLIKRR